MTPPRRLPVLLTALGFSLLSLASLPLAVFSPRLALSLLRWGSVELEGYASLRLGTDAKGRRQRSRPASKAALGPTAVPTLQERDVASALRNQGMRAEQAKRLASTACNLHPKDFDRALLEAIKRAS